MVSSSNQLKKDQIDRNPEGGYLALDQHAAKGVRHLLSIGSDLVAHCLVDGALVTLGIIMEDVG